MSATRRGRFEQGAGPFDGTDDGCGLDGLDAVKGTEVVGDVVVEVGVVAAPDGQAASHAPFSIVAISALLWSQGGRDYPGGLSGSARDYCRQRAAA
jgi:hypothetical protein